VHLLGVAPDSRTKPLRLDSGVKFQCHSNVDSFCCFLTQNSWSDALLSIVSFIINKWKPILYRCAKFTVNPYLVCLATNRRGSVPLPLLKADSTTPTLTFLSSPPILPPSSLRSRPVHQLLLCANILLLIIDGSFSSSPLPAIHHECNRDSQTGCESLSPRSGRATMEIMVFLSFF
jgi:hypothetical protein